MTQELTEQHLQEALDNCADEPVHIPGIIQPFGWLLACDAQTGVIDYVSENIDAVLPDPIDQILGQKMADVVGSETWHNIANTHQDRTTDPKRYFVGNITLGDLDYVAHVSASPTHLIVELETDPMAQQMTPAEARAQAFAIEQITNCTTQDQLFDLTTKLLRHVTGFDRVMIYRFDPEWNGEVIAEARSALIEPWLGLHFPSADIPAQARAIMRKLPIRMIQAADQTPVPLIARTDDLPPLDMTFAHLRGVSKVHMQYLRNADVSATMTLSIVIDDVLWGIISFHHKTPKVIGPSVSQILSGFMPVFCLRLGLIRMNDAQLLSREIDMIQTDIQADLERETELPDMLDVVGPNLCKILNICGIAVMTGSQTVTYGDTGEQAVIDAILNADLPTEQGVATITNLRATIPAASAYCCDFAGAVVATYPNDRALFFFRKEAAQSISWAGNPQKDIAVVDGNARLNPRGSFSVHLQQVADHCLPWTDTEIYLAKRLWPLLSAAERRAFLNDMTRKQNLMINELNHRVRNILSLVKSVSSQARRAGGTLESYSEALEARIHALAAAHDIGAGLARTSVSLFDIIRLEADPYQASANPQITISGNDCHVRAEAAPIFALVIHELMTNAAKYGSLSVQGGQIAIAVEEDGDGMRVKWAEKFGPPVVAPTAHGFGTTLVRQAVPYEMGGTADIKFDRAGFQADLFLPSSVLHVSNTNRALVQKTQVASTQPWQIPKAMQKDPVLIVEDNYMIAAGLEATILDLGAQETEISPSVENAMAFIAAKRPALALLDINLGRGQTSEPIATELMSLGVPFIFVSGYGEKNNLPDHFSEVAVLTKPVAVSGLRTALAEILGSDDSK